jgi:hypothetical protein
MAKRKTNSGSGSTPAKQPAKRAAKPQAEPVKRSGAVYQLKITLGNVRPPIWRRVQVKDCTLADLHEVIQVAMGWESSHLYSFHVRGIEYSDPEMTGGELDMEDSGRAKLSRLIPGEKFKFGYVYDFGDNWDHDIVVEKLLPPEPGRTYPACLAGKRACPPEDVGGAWGYHRFVEAIRNPEHAEHEELLDWAGGEFDAEKFDIDEVNRELAGLR